MEFLSIMSKGTTQEKILWSFDFFDIDRNGYIERQEMIKVWNILALGSKIYFLRLFCCYFPGPRGCLRDGGAWEQRLKFRGPHPGVSLLKSVELFIVAVIEIYGHNLRFTDSKFSICFHIFLFSVSPNNSKLFLGSSV